MKASQCKCIVCGKQAVAFWPIIDPDIPEHPYCRKCLDKAKAEMIMQMFGYKANDAKAMVKIDSMNRQKKK